MVLSLARAVIPVALLLLALQKPAGVPPHPVELDAEPHHQLLLQNQDFKVWQVSVPALEKMGPHYHRKDYVVVNFEKVELQYSGELRPVLLIMRADSVWWFIPQPGHFEVRNGPGSPVRQIEIEVLQRGSSSEWIYDRINAQDIWSDIFNAAARDSSFQSNAAYFGTVVSLFELRPESSLAGYKKEHGYLLVALTDLSLGYSSKSAGSQELIMSQGEVREMPAGSITSFHNRSRSLQKFVAVEKARKLFQPDK